MTENLPSGVEDSKSWFDRFATAADGVTSKSWWFTGSVVLVILWAIWGPFAGFSDTWQLVINTSTTILTFLMVGLAANTTARSTKALQVKLNAIADALADQMRETHPDDARELREAVGLEDETSS